MGRSNFVHWKSHPRLFKYHKKLLYAFFSTKIIHTLFDKIIFTLKYYKVILIAIFKWSFIIIRADKDKTSEQVATTDCFLFFLRKFIYLDIFCSIEQIAHKNNNDKEEFKTCVILCRYRNISSYINFKK